MKGYLKFTKRYQKLMFRLPFTAKNNSLYTRICQSFPNKKIKGFLFDYTLIVQYYHAFFSLYNSKVPDAMKCP